MTMSKGRLIAAMSGYLVSKPAQRDWRHPLCTLQHRVPEDLEQTMCDALNEDEQRLQSPASVETFRLATEFSRAHGVPRGEVTTLCGGNVLLSGAGAQ
jgi:hypothetical protein